MQAVKLLALLVLGATVVKGSPNVPIWEMLNHEEKMGRLMYVFIHLVDSYCKQSNIPDCNKMLTLYGMSNLVNEDDNALNQMNPYQRNSRIIIWEKVMRGDFKIPVSKTYYSNHIAKNVQSEEDFDYINEVDNSPSSYQVNQRIIKLTNNPHPYAVRVPAPSKIMAAYAEKITDSRLVTSDFDKVEHNMISDNSDISEENSDIAVGSSHPYAVKVLPGSPMSGSTAADDKPLKEYEPILTESQVHKAHSLPPTLTILKGK